MGSGGKGSKMGDPNEFDLNKIKIDSKAVSPDYNSGPFYFVEASETGEIRMPCWSPDPDPLMEIMLELLKAFPEDVGVLIKARVETSSTQPKEDEWLRFFGYCNKRAVQNAVVRFRKFIQCDSTHQFMVRNTDTGEYLAFDDYGILWIYSENPKFKEILQGRGFSEKKGQPLINEGPTWRLTAPDSAGQLRQLVDLLMLHEAEKSEQLKPSTSIQ
jgi:hypothetical protein